MTESISRKHYDGISKNQNTNKIRELRELGLTLREIANSFNITGERVRQLCKGIPVPHKERAPITNYISAESLTGCWNWIGSKHKSGYGHTSRTKSGYAHRYIYELMIGEIPDGLCVCHHCDNPSCVNPDHMFVGTMADNMHDRDKKGRNNGGRKLGSKNMN